MGYFMDDAMIIQQKTPPKRHHWSLPYKWNTSRCAFFDSN